MAVRIEIVARGNDVRAKGVTALVAVRIEIILTLTSTSTSMSPPLWR